MGSVPFVITMCTLLCPLCNSNAQFAIIIRFPKTLPVIPNLLKGSVPFVIAMHTLLCPHCNSNAQFVMRNSQLSSACRKHYQSFRIFLRGLSPQIQSAYPYNPPKPRAARFQLCIMHHEL